MRPIKDLVGKQFGLLTVVSLNRSVKVGKTTASTLFWNCVCVCGNSKAIPGSNLKTGNTRSCGCHEGAKTHGMSYSSEYNIWRSMRGRCSNRKSKYWDSYGGRGILVCKRWDEFPKFLEDMGPKPSNGRYSIDRIDNNGNYEPANCRWALPIVQMNNTRRNRVIEMGSERQNLVYFCKKYGVPAGTARSRLKSGWPLDRVFGLTDGRL